MSAFRCVVAHLESEVLLGEIAEADNNHGGDHFGDGGIYQEVLNEQFDEDVVEVYAYKHQEKIAEQLDAAAQDGAREHDKAVQQVTCRKAYGKCHEECGDVWTDSSHRRIYDLFLQNVVV